MSFQSSLDDMEMLRNVLSKSDNISEIRRAIWQYAQLDNHGDILAPWLSNYEYRLEEIKSLKRKDGSVCRETAKVLGYLNDALLRGKKYMKTLEG